MAYPPATSMHHRRWLSGIGCSERLHGGYSGCPHTACTFIGLERLRNSPQRPLDREDECASSDVHNRRNARDSLCDATPHIRHKFSSPLAASLFSLQNLFQNGAQNYLLQLGMLLALQGRMVLGGSAQTVRGGRHARCIGVRMTCCRDLLVI